MCMKIALLGGAFDPPHLGHVQLAEHLLSQEHFDEVWIIPVVQHPFAKNMANFEDRIAMCALAFQNPKIKIKDFEKNLSGYTIDLVKHCLSTFPNDNFYFCGGEDIKKDIPKWKDSEQLLKLIPFQFYGRGKDFFGEASSTIIRNQVQQNEKTLQEISDTVKKYIDQKKIYQEDNTHA